MVGWVYRLGKAYCVGLECNESVVWGFSEAFGGFSGKDMMYIWLKGWQNCSSHVVFKLYSRAWHVLHLAHSIW